ncbi:MAG: GatB/YqeY domain-containing protein [Candidatus Komeilibacteria bacterium]|nr:GatB/YqeY domain-containing protein [Candidatus Komeilibacteria bacterium]
MAKLSSLIEADVVLAMKGRAEVKLAALRLLKAALKDAQIAKRGELTEEDELKVLRREVKKRKESIDNFKAGAREDLAAKETAELAYLTVYLPPELTAEEINKVIEKTIKENNFSPADFGQVMKLVAAELKGQADGARLSGLVKARLV